jgi:thioredoxin 1
MASENVTEVTDKTFDQEVLKSALPVLVDFWAPWCGPCQSIAPIIEDLGKEYVGKLKVVKVNVDDNRDAATKFNVRGIPNLVLIKNGQLQDQLVGAVDKQELVKAITKVL